jgi:hypothetical protein
MTTIVLRKRSLMSEARIDRYTERSDTATGTGCAVATGKASRYQDGLSALAIFAFFTVFFGVFMAREPLWGDSAKLSIYVLENDFGIRGITTGMGHHTFAVMAGRLVADLLGVEAQRGLALACVFSGAGATALFFLLLRRYGISAAVSLFCATALAVAHMNLFSFTIQESYAPMLMLWVGILLCFRRLRKRPEKLTSLVCGALVAMSLLNHSLAVMIFGVILLPALIVRHRFRHSLTAATFGLAGFLIVFLPVLALLMVPDPEPARETQILDAFERWMDLRALPKGLVFFVAWVGYQLPTVFLVIFGKIRRLSAARTVDWLPHVSVIVFTALFTSAYIIQRRMLMMTICLPSFLILAAPVIDRFSLTGQSLRRLTAFTVVFNPIFYTGAAMIIAPMVTKIVPELRVNHWRPADYYFRPFVHLTAPPSAMLRELDERFPPMTDPSRKYLFLMDFTFRRPLAYAQLQRGWRPDIELFELDKWMYTPEIPLERSAENLVRSSTEKGMEIVVIPYPDRLMRSLKLESIADLEVSGDCAIVRLKKEAAPAAP